VKRANSDSLVAGFSLIEAMAALALTATIILALSSVAGEWLPNWRRGFVDLQRADLLGVGLERLVDDLSAAEYVTRSAGAPAPLFEGDASSVMLSVMFVRSAIGPDAYPHLEIVRLAEIKEDRGLAMVRTRARFAPTAPTAPGAPAQAIAFGDPVSLIRAPFHISFAYAGPDRLWLSSWKGREQLPEAVRISVRDTIANRVLAVSTVARVRVIARGAPKPQAEANAPNALPPSGQANQQ
jgi:general secretion pathway protein J